MNSFLSNINKIPIAVKHISGLNPVADHLSRHPSSCTAQTCSIHKFLLDTAQSVIDPAAKCAPISPVDSFTNRKAWLTAQGQSDACKSALHHLKTGKVPTHKPGDINNEMRHYVQHASIAKYGLLVVHTDPELSHSGGIRERIVVPHHVALGLLHHIHNNKAFTSHPLSSQLKAAFNQRFYTWGLQPLLDSLYKHCYTCSVS